MAKKTYSRKAGRTTKAKGRKSAKLRKPKSKMSVKQNAHFMHLMFGVQDENE